MARGISKNSATDTQKLRTTIRRALPPVLSKLYEMALAGDVQAAKLLLDRSLPTLSSIKEPPAISGETRTAQAVDLVNRVLSGEVDAREAAVLLEFLRVASVGNPSEGVARKGISAETIAIIRREIFGIDDSQPDE